MGKKKYLPSVCEAIAFYFVLCAAHTSFEFDLFLILALLHLYLQDNTVLICSFDPFATNLCKES